MSQSSNTAMSKEYHAFHLQSQFAQLLGHIRRSQLTEVAQCIQRSPPVLHLRDRNGRTALHHCADNLSSTTAASIEIAQLLIRSLPELVEAQDNEGNTALHLAVINGNLPLTRVLLKSMDIGQINIGDYELHTVVHWATVCAELDCLTLVLDSGANVATADIYGAHPIHYATQSLSELSPMTATGSTTPKPLQGYHGHYGSTSHPHHRLVTKRANGLRILHHLLSRQNVDVNCTDNEGRTPLLWSASSGNSDALLALVKAGAEISQQDKDGLTALHCASSRGHYKCLQILIMICGADVRQTDSSGCTPLFYATALGHADCVRLLLESGADFDHQDNKGRTAAHCGASKGQLETLKILHQHGANLWVKNVRGDLPLHEAVKSGRKDLVRWLLEMSPKSVNEVNLYGRSPLHIAAFNNNVDLCRLLVSYGADLISVMKVRSQYLTPLDAALQNASEEVSTYLQESGGQPIAQINQHLNEYLQQKGPPNTNTIRFDVKDDKDENENFHQHPKRQFLSTRGVDSFVGFDNNNREQEMNSTDEDTENEEEEEVIMDRHEQMFHSKKQSKRSKSQVREHKKQQQTYTKLPNLVNDSNTTKQSQRILSTGSSSSMVESGANIRNVREFETQLSDKPTHLKQAIITNVYLTTGPASQAPQPTAVYYVKRVPPLKKTVGTVGHGRLKKRSVVITGAPVRHSKTSPKPPTEEEQIAESEIPSGERKVSVVLETRDTFESGLETRDDRYFISEQLGADSNQNQTSELPSDQAENAREDQEDINKHEFKHDVRRQSTNSIKSNSLDDSIPLKSEHDELTEHLQNLETQNEVKPQDIETLATQDSQIESQRRKLSSESIGSNKADDTSPTEAKRKHSTQSDKFEESAKELEDYDLAKNSSQRKPSTVKIESPKEGQDDNSDANSDHSGGSDRSRKLSTTSVKQDSRKLSTESTASIKSFRKLSTQSIVSTKENRKNSVESTSSQDKVKEPVDSRRNSRKLSTGSTGTDKEEKRKLSNDSIGSVRQSSRQNSIKSQISLKEDEEQKFSEEIKEEAKEIEDNVLQEKEENEKKSLIGAGSEWIQTKVNDMVTHTKTIVNDSIDDAKEKLFGKKNSTEDKVELNSEKIKDDDLAKQVDNVERELRERDSVVKNFVQNVQDELDDYESKVEDELESRIKKRSVSENSEIDAEMDKSSQYDQTNDSEEVDKSTLNYMIDEAERKLEEGSIDEPMTQQEDVRDRDKENDDEDKEENEPDYKDDLSKIEEETSLYDETEADDVTEKEYLAPKDEPKNEEENGKKEDKTEEKPEEVEEVITKTEIVPKVEDIIELDGEKEPQEDIDHYLDKMVQDVKDEAFSNIETVNSNLLEDHTIDSEETKPDEVNEENIPSETKKFEKEENNDEDDDENEQNIHTVRKRSVESLKASNKGPEQSEVKSSEAEESDQMEAEDEHIPEPSLTEQKRLSFTVDKDDGQQAQIELDDKTSGDESALKSSKIEQKLDEQNQPEEQSTLDPTLDSFGAIRQLKGKKKSYDHVRPKVDSFWTDHYHGMAPYGQHQSHSLSKHRKHKLKHGGSTGYLLTTGTAHDEYAQIDPNIINQTVEKYLRKYYLERKLFEELYDLKRFQIRTGKSNEPQLVKRLVEKFRREVKAPGMGDFKGPYSYRSYEIYLYDLLRKLSRSNEKKIAFLNKSISYEDINSSFERPPIDTSDAEGTSDAAHHSRRGYRGYKGYKGNESPPPTATTTTDDPLFDYERTPHGLSVDYKYEYHKSQHLDHYSKDVVVDVICENLYKRTGMHGNKLDELAITRKVVERNKASGDEHKWTSSSADDTKNSGEETGGEKRKQADKPSDGATSGDERAPKPNDTQSSSVKSTKKVCLRTAKPMNESVPSVRFSHPPPYTLSTCSLVDGRRRKLTRHKTTIPAKVPLRVPTQQIELRWRTIKAEERRRRRQSCPQSQMPTTPQPNTNYTLWYELNKPWHYLRY